MSQGSEIIDPSTMEIHVTSPDTTDALGDINTSLSVDCSSEFSDDDDQDSGGPLSKRSGSSSRRERKQKNLSPRSREMLRLKINHRERERMHDLNSSMDALRQVMPYAHGPSVKKLSKMATLLLARNYIILLTRSLEEMRRLLAEAYRNQALPPGGQLPGGIPPGGGGGGFPLAGLRLPNLDKHLPGIPTSLAGFPPGGLLSGIPGIHPHPPGHPPPPPPPPVSASLNSHPHHVTAARISPGGGGGAGGGGSRSSEQAAVPPVTVGASAAHIVHHPTPTMALGGLGSVRVAGAGVLPTLPTPHHHPHHPLHHLSAHYTGAPCSCVYCHLAAKSASDSLLKQA